MICRRCGLTIGFIEPDVGYMDEHGSLFCKATDGERLMLDHAPMLDYGSDAASGEAKEK